MREGQRLAFPGPLQGREHPVSCGRIPQHMRLWRPGQPGGDNQKNIRYGIQHADSLDYNAMKCHYLLTQISDILLQLYEKGRPGIREAKNTIKNISSSLLKSFGEPITGEDISFMSAYGYVKAA